MSAPLTETVPVWWVTWGTCLALIPARNRDEAIAIAHARDQQLVPGRYPNRYYASPATQDDRDRLERLGADTG